MNGRHEAAGLRLVGHTDLDGHGDSMHVNIRGSYAYVAHMGETRAGTSVVDVSDPRRPRVVHRIETPYGTHSHKVQVVDDLLLVNYEWNSREPAAVAARAWTPGFKVFDLTDPVAPREIAFVPGTGKGVHRIVYWERPYAYVTSTEDGYRDLFLRVFDLSEPSSPREVGRWWYPGQHAAGGEVPSWPEHRRYALHHALVVGGRAYCSWWDAGLVILNVEDPTAPTLVSHLDLGEEGSGCTHTAHPMPGRDLVVVCDEAIPSDPPGTRKRVRLVDVSDETRPTVVGLLPEPEGDYASRPGLYGPHNMHEMRPGSFIDPNIVHLTYFNAGLRMYDVADPTNPKEIAYFVPEAPPGRETIQLNDVYVDANGLIYTTDRYAGGLYILEPKG